MLESPQEGCGCIRVVGVHGRQAALWSGGVVAAMRVGKRRRQWALRPPSIALSESNGAEARVRVSKCWTASLPSAKQLVVSSLRWIIAPCVCHVSERKACQACEDACASPTKRGPEARAHAHAESHIAKHDETEGDRVLGARPKRQGQAVARKGEVHVRAARISSSYVCVWQRLADGENRTEEVTGRSTTSEGADLCTRTRVKGQEACEGGGKRRDIPRRLRARHMEDKRPTRRDALFLGVPKWREAQHMPRFEREARW